MGREGRELAGGKVVQCPEAGGEFGGVPWATEHGSRTILLHRTHEPKLNL
jgi:hypothetical protein